MLISQVPIKGTTTVYSRIGDSFAWLCFAWLFVSTVAVARKSRFAHGARNEPHVVPDSAAS